MIYADQEQLDEMERQNGGRGGGGFHKRMRGKFVPKQVPPYRVMQNFENRIKASIVINSNRCIFLNRTFFLRNFVFTLVY